MYQDAPLFADRHDCDKVAENYVVPNSILTIDLVPYEKDNQADYNSIVQ